MQDAKFAPKVRLCQAEPAHRLNLMMEPSALVIANLTVGVRERFFPRVTLSPSAKAFAETLTNREAIPVRYPGRFLGLHGATGAPAPARLPKRFLVGHGPDPDFGEGASEGSSVPLRGPE